MLFPGESLREFGGSEVLDSINFGNELIGPLSTAVSTSPTSKSGVIRDHPGMLYLKSDMGGHRAWPFSRMPNMERDCKMIDNELTTFR